MDEREPCTQIEMVWPTHLVDETPPVRLPPGYALRTYRPGDKPRFYEIMTLAGWPGWDEETLLPWLWRILPEGWFMAVHQASDQVVATGMATHDPTWRHPFCGKVGRWKAAWSPPGR